MKSQKFNKRSGRSSERDQRGSEGTHLRSNNEKLQRDGFHGRRQEAEWADKHLAEFDIKTGHYRQFLLTGCGRVHRRRRVLGSRAQSGLSYGQVGPLATAPF